jgi:hypothetical protein
MNRKDRQPEEKLARSVAPTPVQPSPGRGFGADDALAWLTGRRLGAPVVPPSALAVAIPTSSPPSVSEGKIANSVYFKTMDAFRAGRDAGSVVEAVAGTGAYADSVWAEHRPAVEARKTPNFACAAGCAWCCYQQVAVAPAEAVAIAGYLATTLSAAALEALQTKIAVLDEQTRGLGVWARAKMRTACAFLNDGKCSIYAVRPLRCRGVYSRHAAHCQNVQEHPDAVYGQPALAGMPGPYPNEPAQIVDAALSGLMRACHEFGLAWEPLELTAAMRIALTTSELGDRYAKGEKVFAGAELPPRDDGASEPQGGLPT